MAILSLSCLRRSRRGQLPRDERFHQPDRPIRLRDGPLERDPVQRHAERTVDVMVDQRQRVDGLLERARIPLGTRHVSDRPGETEPLDQVFDRHTSRDGHLVPPDRHECLERVEHRRLV